MVTYGILTSSLLVRRRPTAWHMSCRRRSSCQRRTKAYPYLQNEACKLVVTTSGVSASVTNTSHNIATTIAYIRSARDSHFRRGSGIDGGKCERVATRIDLYTR
jgi:hypothetical protein